MRCALMRAAPYRTALSGFATSYARLRAHVWGVRRLCLSRVGSWSLNKPGSSLLSVTFEQILGPTRGSDRTETL